LTWLATPAILNKSCLRNLCRKNSCSSEFRRNGLSEREGFEEREREHGESRGQREAKMEPSTSPPVSTMDQIMAAEQEKWLADAKAAVKQQAFYMKRAIDEDNLRDVFKYSSAMLGELRTSLSSPQKVRPSIPNVLARPCAKTNTHSLP